MCVPQKRRVDVGRSPTQMQRSPPGSTLICRRREVRRGPPDALRAACHESREPLYAVAGARSPYAGDVLSSDRGRILLAAVADVVLVTVFCAIGRASHDEAPLEGLFLTAWPFLAALAAAWGISLAWRRPFAVVRTGVPVWVVTVAGGMLLRTLVGQGTAPAFIVVASVALGVLLLGWRAVAAALLRRSGRSATALADENMKA